MKRLAALLGFAALLCAAPATVQVTQVLYKADGTPYQGTVAISWQQFDTGAGEHIPAGTKIARLSATGLLNVSLVPNVGAVPSGTAYQVTYKLDLGDSKRVAWIVPASGPVTVTAIESTTLVGPSSIVALTQLGSGGAANGQCPVWNSTSGTWVPTTCGAGSSGTLTTISGSGPSWLTWTITNPTTTPVISLAPTAAQTSHQVIGTCGAATTFTPCALVAADLPATTVNAVTNDTNITGSISGQNLTLGWAGVLAAARLNSSVVQAITNDTNITGSITAQNLTLGWAGTLAAARMANAGVHTGDCTTTFPNCTISASAITLAKMANLAANSVICNNTGSGATPIACSVAQMQALLGQWTTSGSDIYNANAGSVGIGGAPLNLSPVIPGTLELFGNILPTHVSADSFGNTFIYRKRGRTGDSTATPASGAELGYSSFNGWNTTTYARGALAIAYTTENWTSGANGTKYSIYTTPNGTTTSSNLSAQFHDQGIDLGNAQDVGLQGNIVAHTLCVTQGGTGCGTRGDVDLRITNSSGYPFASLPAVANGNSYYCSDCTVTSSIDNTAAGSGGGCYVQDINSVHKCVGF